MKKIGMFLSLILVSSAAIASEQVNRIVCYDQGDLQNNERMLLEIERVQGKLQGELLPSNRVSYSQGLHFVFTEESEGLARLTYKGQTLDNTEQEVKLVIRRFGRASFSVAGKVVSNNTLVCTLLN